LLFHSASNNNCNPCSKKYVMLCAACGGLAIILGSLFAVLYVVLRSYTSSLHYFETVPSYVASVSVKLNIKKKFNFIHFDYYYFSFDSWSSLDCWCFALVGDEIASDIW
jgi:hypothetical protein